MPKEDIQKLIDERMAEVDFDNPKSVAEFNEWLSALDDTLAGESTTNVDEFTNR